MTAPDLSYTERISPVVQLNQYRVTWTGPKGMPGVSTFYTSGTDSSTFPPKLRTFFEAWKTNLPSSVTLKYPATGNVVESTTGKVVAVWTGTAPADTIGTGSGSYSSATGVCITALTSLWIGGKRLRGRTFLVPVTSGTFDSQGQVATAALSTFNTAALNLTGGTEPWTIYSPTKHEYAAVTSVRTMAAPCVLRSRRD